jgi:hypothetical protein
MDDGPIAAILTEASDDSRPPSVISEGRPTLQPRVNMRQEARRGSIVS